MPAISLLAPRAMLVLPISQLFPQVQRGLALLLCITVGQLFAPLLKAQQPQTTSSGPPLLLKALEHFNRGNYGESQRLLRQLLDSGSSDPRVAVFYELVRAATGHCSDAIPRLHSLYSQLEDKPQLQRMAGTGLLQCLISQEKLHEAAPLAASLIQRFPTHPDVLYLVAKYHLHAWNNAIYLMFRHAPDSFRANQLSAEIFELQGQYQQAVQEYEKAIAKNPSALHLHFRLGRALLMSSTDPATLQRAIEAFQKELALNPNDYIAEYQIARIYIALNQHNNALPHLERALEINPEFPEALIELGRYYNLHGDHQKAIPLLQRATQLRPQSEAAHYNLMLAYRNAGMLDQARKQQEILQELQQAPEGEFTDFLRKLGEAPTPSPSSNEPARPQ